MVVLSDCVKVVVCNSVLQLQQHYISICIHTNVLLRGGDIRPC
jgi:hypothetical protein